ncbi:hypothetical protein [Bifidobacterium eulemuris]|uniref:Uncharacterized protein n=1 Tax=Bifidobacterium eulemuris TaxID=1765219 RepID=A0A261GC52_9BIFI|nr:hypothetical protein [Bifidobacterium eulemuris]OZG68556.1 hypothetical protein BEUL_0866 [Bifidobacterium eulemuris]QOL32685.1 hypothetical protein BE0216_09735 [Bifidobacterium eulemuris]
MITQPSATATTADSTVTAASDGAIMPRHDLDRQHSNATATTAASRSDILFFAALALLPVDGTVVGFYQPFWTPISPWLFVAYCLCNWRYLRETFRHYAAFLMLPVALAALSIPGWLAFGFHRMAVVMSLTGVLGAVATLAAVHIAVDCKGLPWRRMVRVVLAAYWFAFAVGVLQWVALRLQVDTVVDYFTQLMARDYLPADSPWGGNRPQFLFAEPSYIGMHLFGILLPLFWLARPRDAVLAKRLRDLIVVFAAGSMLMGAGTRIVLDTVVAMVVVIVAQVRWRDASHRRHGLLALAGTAVFAVVGVFANSRLSSILDHGAEGDGSFFARICQSLGPLCGLPEHPWTLICGYGAGNIIEATHAGAGRAVGLLNAWGMNSTGPANWYATKTADTMFTMSGYTSFLTEFGLVGLCGLVALVLWHIARHHAWSKQTVCWLLLVAYLYVQFEGYAFAAIPLLVWGVTHDERLR